MTIPDQDLVQISHTHWEVFSCEIIDHIGSDLIPRGGGVHPLRWNAREESLGEIV